MSHDILEEYPNIRFRNQRDGQTPNTTECKLVRNDEVAMERLQWHTPLSGVFSPPSCWACEKAYERRC